MKDSTPESLEEHKERIRRRMRHADDTGTGFSEIVEMMNKFNSREPKRICTYCRVGKDDQLQMVPYELLQKSYEAMISNIPDCIFTGLYVDEGLIDASPNSRKALDRMIADCQAGRIDLIVTKSVSGLTRNIAECMFIVRDLAQLQPPVGVFFETERVLSLDKNVDLAITLIGALADQESLKKANRGGRR